MCQGASVFACGRGNMLPGNARDVIAAYSLGMADERPLRDGLVRQPARGISPRPLCASRAEAGREAPFDRDYYRRFYFNPRTAVATREEMRSRARLDRKSTRLNSSHITISYAVCCLEKTT